MAPLRGRQKNPNAQAQKKGGNRHAVNKTESVEKPTDEPGQRRKTSTEAISATIAAVTDSLAREERITSVGFGTSQVMEKKQEEEGILEQNKLSKYRLRNS